MSQLAFKPGEAILYMAEACHQLDVDDRRQPLFAFEHVKGLGGSRRRAAIKAGDPVSFDEPMKLVGKNDAGHLLSEEGHVIRHKGPRRPWAGTIASHTPTGEPVTVDAVGNVVPDAEGRILIDVLHPSGAWTLHYAVRYSAAKAAHTFHRQGD